MAARDLSKHRSLTQMVYWGAMEQKTRLRIQATSSVEPDALRSGRNSHVESPPALKRHTAQQMDVLVKQWRQPAGICGSRGYSSLREAIGSRAAARRAGR